MGITNSALEWLNSYLSQRKQTITGQGKSSSPRELMYGVPQGSVLGPELFTMYSSVTYEIAKLHNIEFHSYADDTQLYASFDLHNQAEYDDAMSRLENCVKDLRLWMRENKLMLNDDKTEFLIITPQKSEKRITTRPLKVGEHTVLPSRCAKNLGVFFEDNMSANAQITSIVKSSNYHLRAIGRIRCYLTRDAAEKVVHALISSKLDYGNSLLAGVANYQIKRLQRVQNTAARVIARIRKYDHISQTLLELHWLPVEYRIKFKLLLIVFKCIHELAPEYLSKNITRYSPPVKLRSSETFPLNLPLRNNVSFEDRAFSIAGPFLWNHLPPKIRQAPSVNCFKKLLKTHFFKELKQ